jgi:hypothetical protein
MKNKSLRSRWQGDVVRCASNTLGHRRRGEPVESLVIGMDLDSFYNGLSSLRNLNLMILEQELASYKFRQLLSVCYKNSSR